MLIVPNSDFLFSIHYWKLRIVILHIVSIFMGKNYMLFHSVYFHVLCKTFIHPENPLLLFFRAKWKNIVHNVYCKVKESVLAN